VLKRLEQRVGRIEVALEARPRCSCPAVMVLPTSRRDSLPPPCPACGMPFRIILLDGAGGPGDEFAPGDGYGLPQEA